MSKTNYYTCTYVKKDGSKGTKEFTSTTKKCSQLALDAKNWCKEHGYKLHSGSMGARS